MHLPAESIPASVANLIRILKPGGRLVLTFRHGYQGKEREDDGRLFTPLDLAEIATLAQQSGAMLTTKSAKQTPTAPASPGPSSSPSGIGSAQTGVVRRFHTVPIAIPPTPFPVN